MLLASVIAAAAGGVVGGIASRPHAVVPLRLSDPSVPPTAAVDRPPAPARVPGSGAVICIDPGHPSDQAEGAVSRDGLSEIRANWWMANALRDVLTARGYHVVMTKQSEPEKVSNRRRAEIANEAGARLFLRLHCDASDGSGYAVYYPAKAGHKDGVTGPSAQVCTDSAVAAEAIRAGLAGKLAGKLRDGGVKTDTQTHVGGIQGALTGSIFSEVPVVTVEMLVLTNPSDVRWLREKANQRLLAEALADGVDCWATPPPRRGR